MIAKPGTITEPCYLCNKPLTDPTWFVEIIKYGAELKRASDTNEYKPESEGGHSLGLHPVGPDCAKKLRRGGIWVTEIKQDPAVEITRSNKHFDFSIYQEGQNWYADSTLKFNGTKYSKWLCATTFDGIIEQIDAMEEK